MTLPRRDAAAWIGKLGGRKWLVTLAGMALCALGARWKADGNYYLALGGMVAAFVAGNYGVEKIHGGKPLPQPDGQ